MLIYAALVTLDLCAKKLLFDNGAILAFLLPILSLFDSQAWKWKTDS